MGNGKNVQLLQKSINLKLTDGGLVHARAMSKFKYLLGIIENEHKSLFFSECIFQFSVDNDNQIP